MYSAAHTTQREFKASDQSLNTDHVSSCEGGEGVWIQDIPGAPERNGCVVAEGCGETSRYSARVSVIIYTSCEPASHPQTQRCG